MSCVFVLGAGASHGEDLRVLPGHAPTNGAQPPLLDGFFRGDLYDSLGYRPDDAEKDFKEAFDYIRHAFALTDTLGQGRWNSLNIEEVFTGVELHREFQNPESDTWGLLTVIRNKLVRYIWRIIASCTQYKQGQYYNALLRFVSAVPSTVITFNYDLIFDRECVTHFDLGEFEVDAAPYRNFKELVLKEDFRQDLHRHGEALYLKMHGSLNWFRCTNPTCPQSATVEILADIEDCLYRARGIQVGGEIPCRRCGAEMNPFLIAPLLRKPVVEDRIVRAIWGLARRRLESASQVVVVGFSGAATDFYAAWLLRSTAGVRENVDVLLVNPANDPQHPDHNDFCRRMGAIFPRGFNARYLTFAEIQSVIQRVITT